MCHETALLLVRSAAMERFEPAMLDLYGATWTAANRYEMAPGARRYEIFEKNFVGMVRWSFSKAFSGRILAVASVWRPIPKCQQAQHG